MHERDLRTLRGPGGHRSISWAADSLDASSVRVSHIDASFPIPIRVERETPPVRRHPHMEIPRTIVEQLHHLAGSAGRRQLCAHEGAGAAVFGMKQEEVTRWCKRR